MSVDSVNLGYTKSGEGTLKIEMRAKTLNGVNGGAIGAGVLKSVHNVMFEDLGNGHTEVYKVSFTDYKGNEISELSPLYVDKADIKRLAKAS